MWVQRVCKWEVNQALKAAGPGDTQTPADKQPRGQGRQSTDTSDHGVTGIGMLGDSKGMDQAAGK